MKNGSRPSEYFQFAAWLFDIRAAEALLQGNPREPVDLPVPRWAQTYGLMPLDANTAPLLGRAPDFDPVYAMTTDLAKPVILATLQAEGEDPQPLLIDGCHRVYRAHAEGRATLPAYVLSVAESLAIRCHVRSISRR